MCSNCELFLMTEKERIQWLKNLTATNINLHKKLNEQQELITMLKNKLLEKRSNFLAEYVGNVAQDVNRITENESGSLLARNVSAKLDEVNEFLNIFNDKKSLFQKELENNEKFFSESLTYLNGLVDYFRESLFEELDKSNKMKQFFVQKMLGLASSSHHIVLSTLKEEGERLNHELKGRYRRTIEKSKEEIERQSMLVSKLRKHNKQLYTLAQKTKIENEKKFANLEANMEDLKMTIKQLKEKNANLRTQIKLEVEGCQNDIYDARKKIKKLIKHN